MKYSNNAAMLHALVLTILLTAAFTGCSTTPKKAEKKIETVEEKPVQWINPAIEQAQALLKQGSYSSLIQAVEKIKSAGLAEDPSGSEITYLAENLYKIIYPEITDKLPSIKNLSYSGKYKKYFDDFDNSGPAELSKTTSESGADFFELLLPALILLKNTAIQFPEDYLKKIIDMLKDASGKDVNSVLPPYLTAAANKVLKNQSKEIENLKKSLSLDPTFYPAKIKLARIYTLSSPKSTETLKTAKSLLEETLKQIPPEADVYKMLALAYLYMHEYSKAMTPAAKALMISPGRIDLLLLRARILKDSGKPDQALRMYSLVLKINPKEKDALLAKAELLFNHENKLADALRILSKARKMYPKDPFFPELKGSILLKAGRDNEGLKELSRALDLQPGRLSALRLLLQNAISMKRWIQGAIYLSQILEQSESEDDLNLAYTIFNNLGDTRQALVYAGKLYKSETKEKYTDFYARELHANGKDKEALQIIQKGLEKLHSNKVKSNLYRLRAYITEKTDRKAALQDLRNSLILNPDNFGTIIKIAQVYSDMRMYRKATLYLKHAVSIQPNNPGLKIQLDQAESAAEDTGQKIE